MFFDLKSKNIYPPLQQRRPIVKNNVVKAVAVSLQSETSPVAAHSQPRTNVFWNSSVSKACISS